MNAVSFIVEKGIPAPPKSIGRTKGPLRLALESMEIGDSLVIRGVKSHSIAARMCEISKAIGHTYTRRIEGDATRVWRLS